MSFLAPAALAGLAIAIPVLLLYMLRLRRREQVISSTFLWRQVIQDTEANTPWAAFAPQPAAVLAAVDSAFAGAGAGASFYHCSHRERRQDRPAGGCFGQQ